MIFHGPESKRAQKQALREVYALVPCVPQLLDWSDYTISFGLTNHLDYIPNPGKNALVIDPIIGDCQLYKVLMDGGSGINIIYASTMYMMGLPITGLRPSPTHLHGIVPGKKAEPLGQITLEVIFGSEENFQAEQLCFKVVPFKGGYHALLGRPAFVKFMEIPWYAYMKLKMLGPNGIITVSFDPKNALEAEVANLEHAEAKLTSYGDVKARNEVTTGYTKKPRPSSMRPEVQAPPIDSSSSNWQEATTKG